MAINCINYGLPNRSPKSINRKVPMKKNVLSKCMLKSVELFNPDPMPYQQDSFKPCTVSRLVDIPRRMNDGFTINEELGIQKQRGIIIHKDRYDWSSMKDMLRSQNERLAAEENYIKNAKFLKSNSDQKLKIGTHNLILEGEHILPIYSPEKNESKKERYPLVSEEDTFRRVIPSVVTNYNMAEDCFENIDSQKPIPMDVHKIKLNSRQIGGENISSASVQNQSNHGNADGLQNMYLPQEGRDSFDRLPPINTRHKDYEHSSFSATNPQNDFSNAYRQSERLNRLNVRLNEYVVDAIPVKFNERADIQAELRYLKSMALPTTAKDLYIGRGINLPSTHATKNPRPKYINNSVTLINDVTSNLKIDTPGGGSVTVNTKTPPNKNTPILTNEVSSEKENLIKNAAFESVFHSLSHNNDGFADKEKFVEYINNIEELSDDEKNYFRVVLQSTDKVTYRQMSNVLESIDTIKNQSPSFREQMTSSDNQKIILLSPQLLILLDKSNAAIKVDVLYELFLDTLNLSITMEKCGEIYKDFLEIITQNEDSIETEISQNYILLFLSFFLEMTKTE